MHINLHRHKNPDYQYTVVIKDGNKKVSTTYFFEKNGLEAAKERTLRYVKEELGYL